MLYNFFSVHCYMLLLSIFPSHATKTELVPSSSSSSSLSSFTKQSIHLFFKMIRPAALLFLVLILLFSEAESTHPKPLLAPKSFNITRIQNLATCSYSVVISTSCSSVSYTRDQISISFGDAYGNQIYTPRLDDPSTRTFERCSSDTFEIYGPCAYQICYVYLYRSGPDGWRPRSVEIYGYNSRAVKFYYDTFIPSNTWYGFNQCNSASSSHLYPARRWFIFLILALALSILL